MVKTKNKCYVKVPKVGRLITRRKHLNSERRSLALNCIRFQYHHIYDKLTTLIGVYDIDHCIVSADSLKETRNDVVTAKLNLRQRG